ncbi:hypothetical protein NEPTK9_001789 [Candidatus Neptunochlamydia vexilliferae]|uniref:Uncharacterized protein n=1 Tax=Candidatus Neptunichlamydia vexilliferae TaxID=1651774 RepID=A0ABS0B1I8_9BACT|nr:hypothetical protein [Candidatus Neptunochlamydia vexilliferae]
MMPIMSEEEMNTYLLHTLKRESIGQLLFPFALDQKEEKAPLPSNNQQHNLPPQKDFFAYKAFIWDEEINQRQDHVNNH